MNQVIIISGPPGSGKTSVAQALCERFDRMIHLPVDQIRHWVCAGYRHPWAGDAQAEEQLALARRSACAIARESIAARYAVVIDDVAFAAGIDQYRERLADAGATIESVTLLPSIELLLVRNANRADELASDRVEVLHSAFMAEVESGALPGAVLDNSADGDAYVTADRLQEIVARGEALLFDGRR